MIACYCRVSCRHQKNDSQKAEIERWLKNNGIPLPGVQWFEDKDTAKTLKRPSFDQMQRAIFEGTIRTVVVWKLDRISRRQRDVWFGGDRTGISTGTASRRHRGGQEQRRLSRAVEGNDQGKAGPGKGVT